ncbi:MAG: exodeoxyribonuclease VII small subunit [Myxococcota bacterium]|nr:exodeoxyribonuclease VII small subunit [Myxococcota bacterium]
MSDNERSFEESLVALEERVRKLEAGEIPLEEALEIFEQGIELTRECHEKLDAAEGRIIELTRNDEGGVEEGQR